MSEAIFQHSKLATPSAYALGCLVTQELEAARGAELRGDAGAEAEHEARAVRLRETLAATPARSPADRLAHVVEAKETAAELVAALIPAIADRGLGWKARLLLRLLETIADEGEEPEDGDREPRPLAAH